jgi:plastocyanin
MRRLVRPITPLMTIAVAAACGGGSPAPGPTPTTPPVASTTITITAAGVSPRDIVVARGARVTFVNNDARSHQINSDPHPTHGDCAELDVIGFLASGESKQSGNLVEAGVCGFHDHNEPNNNALKGTITVQ